jgi:hypothetical protein
MLLSTARLDLPDMSLTPSPTTTSPGRLHDRTRAGVGLLLLLAILNAGYLYLVPADAATGYAWPIKPPASAAFLGAGYLAGAVATALVAFSAERRWRAAQPLGFALVTLSVGLMAATLLHTDRFKWDYAPTWVWAAVYTLAPLGIVYLTRRQRASDAGRAAVADRRLHGLRVGSAIAGVALLIYAVALFALPTALGDDWPWPLTPLLAQAVASWLAMIATALLWCAHDLRRSAEAFIPYATLGSWCTALLAVPALHQGDLTRTGVPLLLYLAALAVLLGLALLGMTRGERRSS